MQKTTLEQFHLRSLIFLLILVKYPTSTYTYSHIRLFRFNMKNYKNLFIHILLTSLCLFGFYILAIYTKPLPISDFLAYWNGVDHLNEYTKGGLLFILYAPVKSLGLEPYFSAFLINSLCFILFSYSIWMPNKTTLQKYSHFLLVVIGIWICGYIPIVNTDIPSIFLFVFAIRLFLNYLDSKKTFLLVLAILSLAISLTLRSPLYYICLLLCLVLVILLTYLLLKKATVPEYFKKFLVFLISGCFIAFCSVTILENNSVNQKDLQILKRITFYTGLFSTDSSEPSCGRWSQKAFQDTESELTIPFKNVIISNLKNRPKKEYINIALCKWKYYIFEYNNSGIDWLRAHLQENKQISKISSSQWNYIKYSEYYSSQILKLLSFSLIIFLVYKFKDLDTKEKGLLAMTVFLILGFLGLHTILEIQERYLILPVIISSVIPLFIFDSYYKNKLKRK